MNVWAPFSPCTTACVSRVTPRAPFSVASRRFASVTRVLAALPRGGRLTDPDVLQARAKAMLDALDVRLDASAERLSVPGPVGTLVVANHISWLDILVLLAVEPVTMLAKREVAGWPFIGTAAGRAGTRFIDRDSLYALPAAVDDLAALLRSGRSVMAFPEGTTRCSGTGGTLRRAVFQAAVDAAAPIRPATLSYLRHDRPTTIAAYVGDDTFAASFRRVLTTDALTARLLLHPPIHPRPGADDRRALAARAQSAIRLPPAPPGRHVSRSHRGRLHPPNGG